MLIAADAPNYADVMQGWGAVLSLPLSLGAMVFTGLLLRHELRTRREERYLARSAQARLVRVEGVSIDDGPDRKGTRVKYHVHNRSTRPVFDVHVRHISQDGTSFAPADRQVQIEAEEARPVTISDDPQVATKIGDTKLIHGTSLPYVLVFTDSEGFRWFRREGSQAPELMVRDPQPKPNSIVGLLVDLSGVRPKLRSFIQQLDWPRRWAKQRLRARIWRRHVRMIDHAIDGVRSFLAFQETAKAQSLKAPGGQDAGQVDARENGDESDKRSLDAD